MTLAAIETIVRDILREPTASFWTSAELVRYMNRGIDALWRAIVEIDRDHFYTVDATNVSFAAEATTLTGVPATCARVIGIESRTLTPTGLIFEPKEYTHDEFVRAREQASALVAAGNRYFYAVVTAGAPVAAPTIYMAPKVKTSTLNLTLIYAQNLTDKITSDENPIPGKSDMALVAWTVAYARAKERAENDPDPKWLDIFSTEKEAVLDTIFARQSAFGHKERGGLAAKRESRTGGQD